MLGCYRKGDAADPETYVAAIAATLSRFAVDVVADVTHPFSGLPGKLSFLPTIAEVRAACDELVERQRGERYRQEQLAMQMERRQQEDEHRAAHPETSRREHVERLRAAGKLQFVGSTPHNSHKPWFEKLTATEANEIIARYEKESVSHG